MTSTNINSMQARPNPVIPPIEKYSRHKEGNILTITPESSNPEIEKAAPTYIKICYTDT